MSLSLKDELVATKNHLENQDTFPKFVADLWKKRAKDLENDVLKLKEKLQPLSTAYTETGNVGRPTKDAQDKSAKTVANEESLDRGGSN